VVLRTDAAGIAHETDGRSRIPYAKYRHRKLSTADNRGVDRLNGEGWDYFWPNKDGTVAGVDRKICEFLTPRGS
jgi:hypothetical protein